MKHRFPWMGAALLLLFGLGTGRCAEKPSGKTFVMPPFLVEEPRTKTSDGPRWSYCEAYGFEVLSMCDSYNTELFIQRMKRRLTELALIIPDPFLQETSRPTTVILLPREMESARIEEMVRQLEDVPGTTSMADSFRPLDALRLSDPDSTYLFVVKDGETPHDMWLGARGLLSLEYVYERIERRTPVLPEWFCIGMTQLFRQYIRSRPQSVIETDPWPRDAADSLVAEHPGYPGGVLPLGELFIAGAPEGRSETYRRVWEAQSELFVRWAFMGIIKGGRERLWRFATLAATRPTNEDLFHSCFGMDYAAARKSLIGFAAKANWASCEVDYPEIDIHDLDIRDATFAEIHRIKGEWARRVMRVVRARYPGSLAGYIHDAGELLEGPYSRGERDPNLVSSLALFRIDAGDTAGGEALLEQNPDAVASRPLAGLALAQLHLLNALKNPGGPARSLSEAQAGKILGEVSSTLAQKPPLQSAYVLEARVLEHLLREPNASERARMNEGSRLFPGRADIVAPTVSWDIRCGDLAAAAQLADMGLWEITEPSALAKLRLLRELIPKTSAAPQ
jgi:hypothetical protein